MAATLASGFLDRTSEREVLDRLLANVREGQSAVLVMRGEAGIGKTALLRYAARQASGFRVAQVAGVEAEMELPFSGIHQLCAPVLDRLDALPQPQQNALNVALGLAPGDVPDRFLVGLAVLGLLSAAAEERPLLCLVEDAQWLDAASGLILGFVARRLQADSVAIVVAVREPNTRHDFDGLPELRLRGLAEEDARTLLISAVPGRIDDRVRDRIVAETRGNPLALLELPRSMSAAELAGGFELLPATDLPRHLEEQYHQRAGELPEATQRLLLLAAAEPLGDATLIWRAAQALGIDRSSLAPAEDAQLVEIGARVRFRHPLVRSAVYRAAAPSERRDAHRALAETTDPDTDPDRRAWHRAHAAVGVDEAVAAELERSADRARSRGGAAAAAAFLARAAELTPDPAERGRRTLAAAQAKFDAAAADAALDLLATAELAPLDEFQRAWLERLRAEITFARTRGSDAPAPLLDAARRLEPLDTAMARETHLEAMAAAMFAGRLGDGPVSARSPRPLRLPRRPSSRARSTCSSTAWRRGSSRATRPVCRRSGGRSASSATWRSGPNGTCVGWGWGVAWPRTSGTTSSGTCSRRRAARGEGDGRGQRAPGRGHISSGLHVQAGEFGAASALIAEADAITQATGMAPLKYASLMMAAWRGNEAEGLELIEAARLEGKARGEGMGLRALGGSQRCCTTAAAATARRSTPPSEVRARRHRDVRVVSRGADRGRGPQRRDGRGSAALDRLSGVRRRAAPIGRSASRRAHARC